MQVIWPWIHWSSLIDSPASAGAFDFKDKQSRQAQVSRTLKMHNPWLIQTCDGNWMSWQLRLECTLASLSGMSSCFPPHILFICRKAPETSTSIQARTDWLIPPLPHQETKVNIGESRVLTITVTMEIGVRDLLHTMVPLLRQGTRTLFGWQWVIIVLLATHPPLSLSLLPWYRYTKQKHKKLLAVGGKQKLSH